MQSSTDTAFEAQKLQNTRRDEAGGAGSENEVRDHSLQQEQPTLSSSHDPDQEISTSPSVVNFLPWKGIAAEPCSSEQLSVLESKQTTENTTLHPIAEYSPPRVILHKYTIRLSEYKSALLIAAACLVVLLGMTTLFNNLEGGDASVLQLEQLGAQVTTTANGEIRISFHGDSVVAILTRLDGVPGVRVLDLSHSSVDDGALNNLVVLQELREVDLSHSGVSDEGLQKIDQIASLREVDVRGSAVTSTGVNRFQIQRPDVVIHFDDR